jgi:ribonuclease HI
LVYIVLIFIPGHSGVKGNERADKLAVTAVIYDRRAREIADVLHALCDAGRVDMR